MSGQNQMMGVAEDLIARHNEGDEAAFDEVVAMFRPRVHNYLYRCGCDTATRQDLLQEIFIKVHTGAASYTPRAPLKVWIFTIAANTVRSYFRKQSTQQRVLSPDAPVDGEAADPDALALLEARETASWLEEALARLPLAQREVVILSCVERLEHKEIAEILEIPENTVKTNLRRARLTLAKALARRRRRGDREVADG